MKHRRHTYATGMLRAGVRFPSLMKLLGHASSEMTMRYVDVALSDLQNEYHRARSQPRHLVPHPRSLLTAVSTGLAGVDALLSSFELPDGLFGNGERAVRHFEAPPQVIFQVSRPKLETDGQSYCFLFSGRLAADGEHLARRSGRPKASSVYRPGGTFLNRNWRVSGSLWVEAAYGEVDDESRRPAYRRYLRMSCSPRVSTTPRISKRSFAGLTES
ncbi:MAG: tyrosine-type recombinase/integrase [Bryobacteraceae bacterium]|nr:tyrosine-type recombinase/integrase [Bryobacteraceae bacterium]